jgi:DNA replication protein DnaC
MKQPKDITKKLGTLSFHSNKRCEQHPKQRLMQRKGDDKWVCPKCQLLENQEEPLQREQQKKFEKSDLMRKYRTFERHSLVMDESLLKATIKNYRVDEPEAKANYEKFMGFLKRIIEGEKITPIFHGSPGVGKSHLSYAALRAVNERFKPNIDEYISLDKEQLKTANRGVSCLFVNVEALARNVRESYRNKETELTEGYYIDLLSKVDYLVLDDLGAETGNIGTDKKASDFVTRILYAISTARQSENKINIITTNLSGNNLKTMYDPKTISRLARNPEYIIFKETTDKRLESMPF